MPTQVMTMPSLAPGTISSTFRVLVPDPSAEAVEQWPVRLKQSASRQRPWSTPLKRFVGLWIASAIPWRTWAFGPMQV